MASTKRRAFLAGAAAAAGAAASLASISEQIDKGRTNVMPAHKDFLGPERSRILAAYVWGLSQPAAGAK